MGWLLLAGVPFCVGLAVLASLGVYHVLSQGAPSPTYRADLVLSALIVACFVVPALAAAVWLWRKSEQYWTNDKLRRDALRASERSQPQPATAGTDNVQIDGITGTGMNHDMMVLGVYRVSDAKLLLPELRDAGIPFSIEERVRGMPTRVRGSFGNTAMIRVWIRRADQSAAEEIQARCLNIT